MGGLRAARQREEDQDTQTSMLRAMSITFCYRGTSTMCRAGVLAGVGEGASQCLCQCPLESHMLLYPSAALVSCSPMAKLHWCEFFRFLLRRPRCRVLACRPAAAMQVSLGQYIAQLTYVDVVCVKKSCGEDM